MPEVLKTPENIEILPSKEAIHYISNAETALVQEDPQRKELRSQLKHDLTKLTLGVLQRHGVPFPVQLDSTLEPDKKVDAVYRVTPIIPFPKMDGTYVGVVLYEDVGLYIKPPRYDAAHAGGSHAPTEEWGSDKFHIDLYDLSTRERIGRKSAAYFKSTFANNAESDQADPVDLQGMIGTVKYIDEVMTRYPLEESGN